MEVWCTAYPLRAFPAPGLPMVEVTKEQARPLSCFLIEFVIVKKCSYSRHEGLGCQRGYSSNILYTFQWRIDQEGFFSVVVGGI